MESMSSNLNASLPLNIEEDAELTDRFKESALTITALFKHAQKSRKAAFAQGYHSCVSDLRDYVRSNAEPERPLTVGLIFDYLESRQSQIFRDLDMTLAHGTNHNVNVSTTVPGGNKPRPAKSPSPSSTNGTVRPRSPSTKRPSPRPGNMPSSPPRIAPWTSPTLSPAPFAEPAWSDLSSAEAPRSIVTGWPEISVLPALPVSPSSTFSNVLPSIGTKRKRDALVDVDPRNAGNIHADPHHRRNHGSSKKRKGNVNKGGKGALGLGNTDDWVMDIDDEIMGRERKRPRA